MNYYDFAIKNLKTAQLHMQYDGDMDEVVVSCQQFFEKSFKQLLLLKDGSIYKTHRLTFLIKKLGIVEFLMNEDLFRIIEDYYFDKRYPSEIYEETTLVEASRAYNLAVELKPIIESYLSKYERCKSKDLINSNIFGDV